MKTRNGSPWMMPYTECSLETPDNCHFCQIHQHEASLTTGALRYLQQGAVRGENLMLVTSTSRQAKILSWLEAAGVDVEGLKKDKRLFVHSSQDIINALFTASMPKWEEFEALAARAIAVATHNGEKRVRFYGDAVSDLWASGNHAGVVALEEFWTRLKLKYKFDVSIFCGYVIDAFSPASYSRYLPYLARPHSSVLPTKDSHALMGALDHAGRELLGIAVSKSAMAHHSTGEPQRHRLPLVFEAGYWLSMNHPDAMTPLLHRARSIYVA